MSNGLMPWDDISDETDYEGSFTINGQVITLDRGQKRMATFDSSMLGESDHLAQNQLTNQLDPKPSPPKRPRTTSGDMLSDRSDQTGHRHQTHMAYNILPPGSPGFNGLGALMGSPTQTMTSSSASLQAGSHAPRQDLSGAQQMHHHLRHDDHMKPLNHYMPQHDQMSHTLHHRLPQDFRYAVPTRPTPPPPSQRVSPAHPHPPTRNITPHQSLPPPPQPSQATVAQTNSPTTYSPPAHSHRAQVQAAGLTEAQRRTEAILQLQTKDGGMPDEDLVEVLAEFETNVAAADTYLAIQREGLRKLWLGKVIKKRRGR